MVHFCFLFCFFFYKQNLKVFLLFHFQNFKQYKSCLAITICYLFKKIKNTNDSLLLINRELKERKYKEKVWKERKAREKTQKIL